MTEYRFRRLEIEMLRRGVAPPHALRETTEKVVQPGPIGRRDCAGPVRY